MSTVVGDRWVGGWVNEEGGWRYSGKKERGGGGGGKEVKVERLTKTACREEGILKKTRGSFYTQQRKKTREKNLNINRKKKHKYHYSYD